MIMSNNICVYIYMYYTEPPNNNLEQHVLLWARFSGYATPIYIDKVGKMNIIKCDDVI